MEVAHQLCLVPSRCWLRGQHKLDEEKFMEGGSVDQIQGMGKDSRIRRSEMNTDGIPWIIEYLWIPLWGAVIWLFRKVIGLEKDNAVFDEFKKTQEATRAEMLSAIKSNNETLGDHNTAVLSAVDSLAEQVKGNGRRIGSIEEHLRKNGSR